MPNILTISIKLQVDCLKSPEEAIQAATKYILKDIINSKADLYKPKKTTKADKVKSTSYSLYIA